ncbi:MAG: SWIM zinc finger family protein, partial [Pseudomonadota bacterium]|nr:SWIM zinc finger family protein [Pseudomonadota bacterium]
MSLASLKIETIKLFFPRFHFVKGEECFKAKQVGELTVAAFKGNEYRIKAKVTSAAQITYQVNVNVKLGGRFDLRGTCTCPMVFNCKHVVATLLKAVNEPKIMKPVAPVVVKPMAMNIAATKTVAPVPCLRLSQVELKYFYYDRPEKWPVAELSFRYGDAEIIWHAEDDYVYSGDEKHLTQWVRDKEQEEHWFDELLEYDLELIEDCCEKNDFNRDYLKHFLIDEDVDPMHFSAYVVPELRAEGWIIEMSADYPYRIINDVTDDWYSTIEETSGNDWFNLELGITINGENLNLLPILQNFLSKLRSKEYLQSLDDDETILVPVPQGGCIKLPVGRVRGIFSILIELYDKTSLLNEGKLALSRLDALRLAELDAAMQCAKLRWFGGENLRKLGAKLMDFQGIEAVTIP